MRKADRALFALLFSIALPLQADYQIKLMNNTPKTLALANHCSRGADNSCQTRDSRTLQAYQRQNLFTLDNRALHKGESYTAYSRLSFPDSVGQPLGAGSYIAVTINKNEQGTHIQQVSVFANGTACNLFENASASGGVPADRLAQVSFDSPRGDTYTLYAATQKDRLSFQNIDSLYLTLHQKPWRPGHEQTPSAINLATYNIQAFPFYMSAAIDRNKTYQRVADMCQHPMLRNYDMIAFEEAWDRGVREQLINCFRNTYPWSFDPEPAPHKKLLNSGLLVLSRYPFQNKDFLTFADHHTMADADRLANKGIAYVSIDKNGQPYHFFITHLQAQLDDAAVAIRQKEIRLLDYFIGSKHINTSQPVLIMGDLNIDYYSREFADLDARLPLAVYKNREHAAPVYSFDAKRNLMIPESSQAQARYDYIAPLRDHRLPGRAALQITPLRAVDDLLMYQTDWGFHNYHKGDIELSDHFLVQAKLDFH